MKRAPMDLRGRQFVRLFNAPNMTGFTKVVQPTPMAQPVMPKPFPCARISDGKKFCGQQERNCTPSRGIDEVENEEHFDGSKRKGRRFFRMGLESLRRRSQR